ncbi:DUF2188 domain-containing protein [Bacillus xiapuensis]|uniref:DUF2188 domain-containing protein n=1 Tax=Bacillus xiapuensis TaxID=2014075 RepID=UPI000C2409F6|nr:DUF2188 domain-containing protein [Bacillus xiapuensis]
MPWNQKDYPDSMKNLPLKVRNKAIEIANALLDEGYDEGRSIAIAIDRARSAVGKGHGSDGGRPVYHVQPDDEGRGWRLMKEDGHKPLAKADAKEELTALAKQYAKKHEGILVIHRADGSEAETLYDH